MATKAKTRSYEQLTREEQLLFHAEKYQEIKASMKQLEKDLKVHEEELKAYASDQPSGTVLGQLTFVKSPGKPKIVGATGKVLETKLEILSNKIPDTYKEIGLDVPKIFAAFDADAALRQYLHEVGLHIEQTDSIRIVQAKA